MQLKPTHNERVYQCQLGMLRNGRLDTIVGLLTGGLPDIFCGEKGDHV